MHRINCTAARVVCKEGETTYYTVKADKEVIIAAGTIHTPQILQLSGLGPIFLEPNLLGLLMLPVCRNRPEDSAGEAWYPCIG